MRSEWREDGRCVRVVGRWHCVSYYLRMKYVGDRVSQVAALRYCRKEVRKKDQRYAAKHPGVRPAVGWAKI